MSHTHTHTDVHSHRETHTLSHTHLLQMSRCSSFRCSKLRQVWGKPSSRGRSYGGVPITRSVHDNHFCSVNPCFVAVVTECGGGGSFLVLPVHQVGGGGGAKSAPGSGQNQSWFLLRPPPPPDRQGGPSAPQGVWTPGTSPGREVEPVRRPLHRLLLGGLHRERRPAGRLQARPSPHASVCVLRCGSGTSQRVASNGA